MKLALCLLAPPLAFGGCEKKEFRETPAGTVRFADADVSIDIGSGWLRIDAVPEGMCSPTLAGKPGLIQVYWARSEFRTIDALIAQAKTSGGGEFGEERAFRSEAGIEGKYYSVAQHSQKSGESENRVTTIFVPTRSGRLLVLSLVGPDGSIHLSTREA